jgi:hypothetical protein
MMHIVRDVPTQTHVRSPNGTGRPRWRSQNAPEEEGASEKCIRSRSGGARAHASP